MKDAGCLRFVNTEPSRDLNRRKPVSNVQGHHKPLSLGQSLKRGPQGLNYRLTVFVVDERGFDVAGR